ncbi:MAG TPA: hypothetical protein VIU61_21305 [Kofleriaceae bacterium]
MSFLDDKISPKLDPVGAVVSAHQVVDTGHQIDPSAIPPARRGVGIDRELGIARADRLPAEPLRAHRFGYCRHLFAIGIHEPHLGTSDLDRVPVLVNEAVVVTAQRYEIAELRRAAVGPVLGAAPASSSTIPTSPASHASRRATATDTAVPSA